MHDKAVESFCKTLKEIHDKIIENSPDKHDFKGVRDEGALYYTIYKILNKQSKGTDPITIAAHCYLKFATRHIFHEGNKRMAHMVAQIFLLDHGIIMGIDYNEAKEFILKIARGEKTLNEIKQWISKHITKLEKKKPN